MAAAPVQNHDHVIGCGTNNNQLLIAWFITDQEKQYEIACTTIFGKTANSWPF